MDSKSTALVLEGQPHFGYFQALYRSFYSSKLYLDVAKRWRGFGIIYLLLVIALFVIPFSLRLLVGFVDYFNNQIIQPISNLPDIYVQNGKVVFDKPMPYLIKNKQGEVVSIIDTNINTNAKTTEIDKIWPHWMIFITQDTLSLRVPDVNLPWLNTINPLSEQPDTFQQKIFPGTNEVFSAKNWVQSGGIHSVKYFGVFMVYPMVLSVFVSMIVLGLPVLALLGQLFSRILFSWPLPFTQACRLMAVASTPALLVFFILITTGYLKTGVGFILLAVWIIYFCLAVLIVKKHSKQVARF